MDSRTSDLWDPVTITMMPTDDTTNILVVDDLPEKILVYRTILDELNLHLVTASSGEEALRAVLQHDFAGHPPRCTDAGNGWI